MYAPDEKDDILRMPHLGGIFQHQVCLSFATHMHDLVLGQVRALERVARRKKLKFTHLTDKIRKWNREQLDKEAQAWLRDCPGLTGMYQFSMMEMVRQYAAVFPVVKKMGIRVPTLSNFLFCFLNKFYQDPLANSGRFASLSSDRTSAIVLQRLTSAMCETMKVNYFPHYAAATSSMWTLEPQLPSVDQDDPPPPPSSETEEEREAS